ncbi:serine/threonine protein kinase [Myxococcota bacterium]|nr:serine/threonine protein kinase [Myxococcota bacterium]
MTSMQPFRLGKYLCLEALTSTPPIQEFKAVDTSERCFRGFYKIKIVHAEAAGDVKAERALVFEAKIAQELLHPNIVGLFDAGKMDGRVFIAQEYVWGRSLLQFFRRLRDSKRLMSPLYAAHITAEVLNGLNHAHGVQLDWAGKRPVVHQNLNPRDIILSFDGSVKVNDFGILPVKVADAAVSAYDFRRLGYLSPEQVQGKSVDLRTDVFSAGVLLYEMLTGYPAFLDKTGTQVLERIRNNSFAPLREGNSAVPKELVVIVQKAMAGDRTKRYQSCLEMRAALEVYLGDSGKTGMGDALGVLMKRMFLPEIKKEIVACFELDKSGKVDGGVMLKTVPVILFNMVKEGVKRKKTSATDGARGPEDKQNDSVIALQPTVLAIKRAAAVVDVDDDKTSLTVDHLSRSRTTKSSASVVTSTFSDEETKMLIDSTDSSIFEDEKTIMIGEERSDFEDDATVLLDDGGGGYFMDDETVLVDDDGPVQPASSPQRDGSGSSLPLNSTRKRAPAPLRAATGYYEAVDVEEARAALQAASESQKGTAPPASNRVMVLIVGLVAIMVITLLIIVIIS